MRAGNQGMPSGPEPTGVALDAAALLTALFEADPDRHLEHSQQGTVFQPPFVAVASAEDPWFGRLKEVIGEFYWTPREALALTGATSKARSVLCWCLPVAPVACRANRQEDRVPAREWAYVRTFGEELNTRLRHGVERHLRSLGFAALAPAVAPANEVRRAPGIGLTTSWSERHTAFVAGLGTFGISGGLITARGKAHRLGSVVTDALFTPAARPYGDDPFAWCLRLARGTCGACARRCPAGSIGEGVHDRDKDACASYYQDVIVPWGRGAFGWEGVYGCGLCQTKVPCENCNPTAPG